MGSNKNKNKTPAPAQSTQPNPGDSPVASSDIFKQSGNDPRGRVQNRILDESSRYRGQMDPFISQLQGGYGDALGRANQDYGNIMNRYQDVASGGGPRVNAQSVSYTDPFTSYGDYQGFSKTGGYSPTDIADLRSRGAAPVRAAYAQAEQGVNRQRALQGGYSPNATAVLAKMAREQSQAGADAMQNVNAGIVNSRNQNQLAGLAGMRGIEDSRLNAQIDTGKFNANSQMFADQQNAGNALEAMRGMSSLYGTTPGMANMFGDQLGRAIDSSGRQGTSYISGEDNAQERPGAFQNTTGKITTLANMGTGIGAPILDTYQKVMKQRQDAQNQRNRTGIAPTPIQNNPNMNFFNQQPQQDPFMGPQEQPWDPTMWGQ